MCETDNDFYEVSHGKIMSLGGDFTAGLTDLPCWNYTYRHGYREGLWNRLRFKSSELQGSMFVGNLYNDFNIYGHRSGYGIFKKRSKIC